MTIETIRLSNDKDIKNVIRRGVGCRTGLFNLKALRARNSDSPAEIAFVVSKKVSNKAVVRNKIRRRVREAFSAQGGFQGWRVVVFPSIQSLEADFEEIKKEAHRCSKRLRDY